MTPPPDACAQTALPTAPSKRSHFPFAPPAAFYTRAKVEHGGAVCLFVLVRRGIVVAFYDDATLLSTIFGLHASQAESGPATGGRCASFPAVMLERHRRTLERRGLASVVLDGRVTLARRIVRRAGRRPQNKSKTIVMPREAVRRAAEVRASWSQEVEQERAGVYAVIPAQAACVPARALFGRPANDR